MIQTLTSIFKPTIKKASFEDVQSAAISRTSEYMIINTLPVNEQSCLIKNTMPYTKEENSINQLINDYDFLRTNIIVYGMNSNDETGEKKCIQLQKLGFTKVYLYCGGMFEWMLLQDIYGFEEFPTTTKILDILKYKPSRLIN